MVSQFYSPLRYPGGKDSLYDFLKKVVQHNDINDGIYAEAFAGGAGAALKLLMLEDVNKIYLNDSDVFIYKFWKSILESTDDFLRLVMDTAITIEEWKYRKNILKDPLLQKSLSDLEIGFTTFFLNRCNRSGILSAGPIGGNNQDGNWKIDARFNKVDLVKRIERIAYYKDRISLFNLDCIDFLKLLGKAKLSENEIITYLDPPYVTQGKELYQQYFVKNDHVRLATFLQRKYKKCWVTSYDDHELIHEIYKEVPKNIFHFNYYVNQTKVGRELVISSKKCLLPTEYLHYSMKKNIGNNLEILSDAS